MKIAILTTGNLDDMKGVMNYVHEKALRFTTTLTSNIESTCFFIVTRYVGLLSLFRRDKVCMNVVDGEVYRKNGVDYNIIVREYGLIEALMCILFNDFVSRLFAKKVAKRLKEYDVISCHQLPCIYTSMLIKQMTGKPYIATWHGSDINVTPKTSKRLFSATKKVLENANNNYFVSKGLLLASSYITDNASKEHIYTGPSSFFYKYPEAERETLRIKYGVDKRKVILFCGNLIPIKNVLVLPEVYLSLTEKLPNEDLQFWIVGNGKLGEQLEKGLKKIQVDYRMFGKVEPNIIPNLMNCADVLVVPSVNEGFPLVVLEARTCGCNVVASNVGGLPESAGEDNTFPLGENFADEISTRMVEIIVNRENPVPLDKECSWEAAVEKELNFIQSILKI